MSGNLAEQSPHLLLAAAIQGTLEMMKYLMLSSIHFPIHFTSAIIVER